MPSSLHQLITSVSLLKLDTVTSSLWTQAGLERHWWWPDAYGVFFNLLVGVVVSFIFYWLVVHIPEKRKKCVIKQNLLRMYLNIKRDILQQVLHASMKGGRRDLPMDMDGIDELMKIDRFRASFQGGRQGDEGFYAFENHMSYDSPEFREIVLLLHFMSKQIEYVLHNYDFQDEGLFGFFKRVEIGLLRLQGSEPGYDESKPLCQFIYEIFSGFNSVTGYRDYDFLEKNIREM